MRNTGVAECTSVVPDGGTEADLRAVCATLSAMTDAWDRNDADAYGATFTENATYTTFIGTHYQGRADVTEGHRALFRGFLKGSKLADSFLDIRDQATGCTMTTNHPARVDNR
ncbi:SgcJ/EcaC family oxidoreductase [Nocardia sp. XZ_19_231]|uniref:SgcJ/EcaC family oxidoreductase n=1 Tax=Nocardia sp. XZ_19_231 TaxID=2769252 RepID=UPI00351C1DAD